MTPLFPEHQVFTSANFSGISVITPCCPPPTSTPHLSELSKVKKNVKKTWEELRKRKKIVLNVLNDSFGPDDV